MQEAAMRGLITGRDVLLHPFAIIRGWGARSYLRTLRAVFSGRPTTFLSIIGR
jgi:hypothetical protein